MIEIKAGRHPLLEVSSNTVVPNPTQLGGRHWNAQPTTTESDDGSDFCKMAVLTGPNACGKSVYLKQVGLIAYLAHLGSWVPAERAVMPAMDAIRTRIQTVDSMALGLSAFAVDLNQVDTVEVTNEYISLLTCLCFIT